MQVQTPGRYVGGEFGIIRKNEADLTMALAFPDLYEIGMSNLAMRKMYTDINQLPGVRCERVFCPAPDYEAVLRQNGVCLYTLETFLPLTDVDLLGFSIGYELSATNIITMLERGGIGVRAESRTSDEPIVIAGGPAISNPKPLSRFMDAFYFGEAEASFYSLLETMAKAKRRGQGRDVLLGLLLESDYVWSRRKKSNARRAVWCGFGQVPPESPECLPVPSIRTVQDHGVIEIMRGCPNGCRFCHAGFYYRPSREKGVECIVSEANMLINDCGYREITLSSLSTGDYSKLMPLIERLVRRYSSSRVSFALPSLRVDDFTLPIIELLGSVRKSGLTFAVETPDSLWQAGLNKRVEIDGIIEILNTAEENGWRSAKLYFMVGLPVSDKSEGEKIVSFIQTLLQNTGMNLHVNIGTFIPKPHTPFERSPQLTEEEALRRINTIRSGVKSRRVKFGYHAPFTSFLEGMITRGDERVGEIVLAAHKNGARLDAWEDHLNRSIWRSVIEDAGWDVEELVCSEIPDDRNLPWCVVDPIVSTRFLHREMNKSNDGETTGSCEETCTHNCGVCNERCRVQKAEYPETYSKDHPDQKHEKVSGKIDSTTAVRSFAYLISYEKHAEALFWSHINIMTIFERTLQRAGLPVAFSQGYNPKPRIDFAQPLPLGVPSRDELVQIVLHGETDLDDIAVRIGEALPEGLRVRQYGRVGWDGSTKLRKLMSMYDSSLFSLSIPDYRQVHRTATDAILRSIHDFGPVVDARNGPGRIDGEYQILTEYRLSEPRNGHSVQIEPLRDFSSDSGERPMLIRCVSVKKMLGKLATVAGVDEDILGILNVERVATLRKGKDAVEDYFSLCL